MSGETVGPFVVGIDSSTQSTKVEVVDIATGATVATGRAAHIPTTPPVSEQDPLSWWDALLEALSQVRESLPHVVAMAVAGQQHGMVLLDHKDRPVRPAKLWNDTTSAPQSERLIRAQSPAAWANICGSVPGPSFTVSKLAWMVEHEAEALATTADRSTTRLSELADYRAMGHRSRRCFGHGLLVACPERLCSRSAGRRRCLHGITRTATRGRSF